MFNWHERGREGHGGTLKMRGGAAGNPPCLDAFKSVIPTALMRSSVGAVGGGGGGYVTQEAAAHWRLLLQF